jgi:hypothetical protein
LWVAGWIGCVYGVQLALLVLALLWLVGYDYLLHPDGPAMMAIIIPSMAVVRDAFEIGHVRNVATMGRPFPTLPDGAALWVTVASQSANVVRWVTAGVIGGVLASWPASMITNSYGIAVVQIATITVIGGTISLLAYLRGFRSATSWIQTIAETKTSELLKYWWWPGLAFTSTYYLVMMGALLFLVGQPAVSTGQAALLGGFSTGMMALYCYYLGYRRSVEEEQGTRLAGAMLRCPFVMGILGRSSTAGLTASAAPGSKIL